MASIVLALALYVGVSFAAPQTFTGRIVGGNDTTIDKYPSMVQVEARQWGFWGSWCGGNILNSMYILSAAHCTSVVFDGHFHSGNRRIRAGATYTGIGGVIHEVDSVLNHHLFNYWETQYEADICLIRLENSLIFNNVIQNIAIVPQNYVVPDNVPVVHAGWGRIWTNGPITDVLQDVTIYTVNNEICRYRFADPPNPTNRGIVSENMICAGILDEGGKDACQGDSGGPLYYGGVLIGLVSWGGPCADSFLPGVSTRVASFTDWIVLNAV